jgi:hypothetical protein
MQVPADAAHAIHGLSADKAGGLRDAAVSGDSRHVLANGGKVPDESAFLVDKDAVAVDNIHVGASSKNFFDRG